MLQKIDRLRLPVASRPDIERILIRQVSKEIDRALPWQAGHGRRTATVAIAVGRTLNLTEGELHHLALASYLHDVGLLTLVPGLTAERLEPDPEVYARLQCHPRLGAQLLEHYSFLDQAAVLVAHHHERWDGAGYPYGIRGPFIPLGARILSVADAFDAIEVPGVDSVNLRDHVAYRIIRVAAGTQFDPSIVARLADVLESRMIGTCVGRIDE